VVRAVEQKRGEPQGRGAAKTGNAARAAAPSAPRAATTTGTPTGHRGGRTEHPKGGNANESGRAGATGRPEGGGGPGGDPTPQGTTSPAAPPVCPSPGSSSEGPRQLAPGPRVGRGGGASQSAAVTPHGERARRGPAAVPNRAAEGTGLRMAVPPL